MDSREVILRGSNIHKSLLYALSGMGKIDKGMTQYRGTNITDMSEKEKANLRAREFGFIFQEPQLVSNLTIFENVAISGWIADKQDFWWLVS